MNHRCSRQISECSLALATALFSTFSTADYFTLEPNPSKEPVYASTYSTTLLPSFYSSETTDDLSSRLLAAQDDAAAYVASNGNFHGPYLESALREVRQDERWTNMNEPALVQAILASSVLSSR